MALPRFKRSDENLNKARSPFNGPNIFNFKTGSTQFRIMPAYNEKGVWFHRIREHFIEAANRGMVCIEPVEGRCPVCEYGASLAASGKEKLAEKYKPSTKYLVNAIILSEPTGKITPREGVKTVRLGSRVFSTLFDYDQDFAGGYGDIVDYEHGFNVKLDKSGEGLNTEYIVKVMPQRVDIIKFLSEQSIDVNSFTLAELDSVVPMPSYEDAANEFVAMQNNSETEEVAEPVAVSLGAKAPVGHPIQEGYVVPSDKPTLSNVPKFATTIAPPVIKKGN